MTDRFLTKKEVCFKLGISRATLDRRRKDDPAFPLPSKGEKPTDRCYWLESEIDAYMRARPRETRPTLHAAPLQ